MRLVLRILCCFDAVCLAGLALLGMPAWVLVAAGGMGWLVAAKWAPETIA